MDLQGLPADVTSINNALLVSRSLKPPLMIDPQEQAVHWIKSMDARNNLKVVHPGDSRLLNVLEACLRLGEPLLVRVPNLSPVAPEELCPNRST